MDLESAIGKLAKHMFIYNMNRHKRQVRPEVKAEQRAQLAMAALGVYEAWRRSDAG